jgi:hypothetical protein
MLNALPFIGWFLSLVFSVSLAIPFWLCWTVAGFGAKYFYWLPPVYQSIPFWSCVGLFMVISILKAVLIPRLASVSNNTSTSKKETPPKKEIPQNVRK